MHGSPGPETIQCLHSEDNCSVNWFIKEAIILLIDLKREVNNPDTKYSCMRFTVAKGNWSS